MHMLSLSAGQILLDKAIVRQMRSLAAMPEGLAAFADSMFTQIARFVGIRVTPSTVCSCHALAAPEPLVRPGCPIGWPCTQLPSTHGCCSSDLGDMPCRSSMALQLWRRSCCTLLWRRLVSHLLIRWSQQSLLAMLAPLFR